MHIGLLAILVSIILIAVGDLMFTGATIVGIALIVVSGSLTAYFYFK